MSGARRSFGAWWRAESVGEYLDRIRKISRSTKQDDPVFTNHAGQPTKSLYYDLVEILLTDSGLLTSSSGKRRGIYCFRHTYATFRLTEVVDVYFLAKAIGFIFTNRERQEKTMILLLCGGDKGSQAKDIKLAKRLLNELE